MHRDLNRLSGASRALALIASALEERHVGRHVNMQRFNVDAAPHAADDELVALRAFGAAR